MNSSLMRFLDHVRHTTDGRTPLDVARCREFRDFEINISTGSLTKTTTQNNNNNNNNGNNTGENKVEKLHYYYYYYYYYYYVKTLSN
jgi:hypothetical protein